MHYGSNALTNANENHSQKYWGILTPIANESHSQMHLTLYIGAVRTDHLPGAPIRSQGPRVLGNAPSNEGAQNAAQCDNCQTGPDL